MITLLENSEELSLIRTSNIHRKPNVSQGLYSQISICDFIYSPKHSGKQVCLPCFTSQGSGLLREGT